MNGVILTLRALHHGENHLRKELLAAAERHRAEHEIHHVATDLAHWSHQHSALLADAAQHHGLDLTPPDDHPPHSILSTARAKTARIAAQRPEPALVLLRDLHDLLLAASSNSAYWEMLAQGAQALKDGRLLGVATACHPQTLRQIRWTNTMIKTLSPQALASSPGEF